MSTKWTEPITCVKCGRTNQILVFESLSVDRLPECRAQTLDRSLMTTTCECGQRTAIVKPILYADMTRGWWIHVELGGSLADAERIAGDEFATAFDAKKFPPAVAALRDTLRMRLVFGYEELREKVVCGDHDLDDRLVEILKLDLLATSDLLARGGETLVLEGADAELLHFVAIARDGGRVAKLAVRRAAYDGLVAQRDVLATKYPELYANCYVNALRYAASA